MSHDPNPWTTTRHELDGLPDGGLNIAHEAVGRHLRERPEQVAIRFLGREGDVREMCYRELAGLVSRFARLLGELGVERGERVMTLLGREPALYVTALGTLAAGGIYCPLFASFGPEPVRTRLELGEARVLVTTSVLYKRRGLAEMRRDLPHLEHVLLVDAEDVSGTGSFWRLVEEMPATDGLSVAATGPEDPALLHFTSGTTGAPKGALHVHEAVVAHRLTGRAVLEIEPGTVYWCSADPGWVTGVSYGIVAPLVCGATMIVDVEEFDAERWYRILAEQEVEVFYTAPTAIRMLMRLGLEPVRRHEYPRLRLLASVGEPLHASAVRWGETVFGRPFRDTWWQTETGAIMIANWGDETIVPGSMGRPVPGIEAAIVKRSGDGGGVEVVEEAGVEGELALRRGWPSMFRAYLGQDERYRRAFAGDWYLSGDLARREADGRFLFVGRADDTIKSAGHLIGPFEVESVLLEHEAVAEAGVIGRPDEMAGEIVKAFVSLKSGHAPDADLERALIAHARRRLGPAVAPREIEFRDDLPKTPSGKILRRVLKARELGLPEPEGSFPREA